MPDRDEYITARDIAEVTGFSERYIIGKLDKAGIDLTSVRVIDDGRIVAKTQGGANRILYGIDSGERGRSAYWSSYGAVRSLIVNQADYPELQKYGAQIFYPRFEVEHE